jgi:glycosyltransferase involved in cell wall biosynthesis
MLGTLLIIRNGPQYDSHTEHCPPNIVFLGHKKNVNEYLKSSKYYISTSLSEGLPMSSLEALSVGLPLILSDIPAHREIFNKTINSCHLLKSNRSYKDLATELLEIKKTLNPAPNNDAYQTFINNFSAKKMANKYEIYYENQLDEKI